MDYLGWARPERVAHGGCRKWARVRHTSTVPLPAARLPVASMNAAWSVNELDRSTAAATLEMLSVRGQLFADRHMEDEAFCVGLAIEIIEHLALSIGEGGHSQDFVGALAAMRAATQAFVGKAGPGARNFTRHGWPGADPFALALGELAV